MDRMCSKCKQVLPLESFHKWSKSKDGLFPWCKACKSANDKRYYKANAEKVKAKVREYYWENPEKVLESKRRSSAKHRAKNSEKLKERSKRYRKLNREKCLSYYREHYAKNRQACKARISAWNKANKAAMSAAQVRYRANNPEKVAARTVIYRANNPEKVRAWNLNRRAMRCNAGGEHTAEQIKERYSKQQGKCAACKTELNGKYHADHIIPLIRGGSNDISNIQLLCPPCNLRKNAKDPIEFMQSLGFLI